MCVFIIRLDSKMIKTRKVCKIIIQWNLSNEVTFGPKIKEHCSMWLNIITHHLYISRIVMTLVMWPLCRGQVTVNVGSTIKLCNKSFHYSTYMFYIIVILKQFTKFFSSAADGSTNQLTDRGKSLF